MSDLSEKEMPFLERVEAEIATLVAQATEADKKRAEELAKPTFFGTNETITPMVAALIMARNSHNRRISNAQVDIIIGILMRGEWKRTHQGVAFYIDGTLMDGQHRLIASILAKMHLDPIMVSGGYAKEDNDAIDAGVKRTASDAAALAGVKEAAIKCGIIEGWMKYKHQLEYGAKMSFTNHQIKVKAVDFDKELTEALSLADLVLKDCAIAPMNRKEVAARIFEMINAGWSSVYAQVLLTLVNQGTADYDGAPTVFLSEAYQKDKDDKSKFKLTGLERQAMFHKVADLYAHKKRVTKSAIAWKPGTPLPPMKPTDTVDGGVAEAAE